MTRQEAMTILMNDEGWDECGAESIVDTLEEDDPRAFARLSKRHLIAISDDYKDR